MVAVSHITFKGVDGKWREKSAPLHSVHLNEGVTDGGGRPPL